MDPESDILTSLKSNVCKYFSQKCTSNKCKLISCHTSHLNTAGGDGLDLVRDISVSCCKVPSIVQLHFQKLKRTDSFSRTIGDTEPEEEAVISDLINHSRSWPLVLKQCTLQKERFVMHVDRALAFKTALHIILSQGHHYGCGAQKCQGVLLTSDVTDNDVDSLDLTQYRVQIIREMLSSLLTAAGYGLVSDKNEKECLLFHVTSRHVCDIPSDCVRVLCGVVLNRKQGTKEKEMLVKDYVGLRSKDVKMRSCSEVDQEQTERRKLSRVGLRVELLSVRPNQPVSLDVQPGDDRSNKAVPILYTCARIAVLRKRFEELVEEGVYPPLLPLEEVDFSLLVKEEEWQLLYGCLLAFPSLLQECVEHIKTAQPQPHLLYRFLINLCRHYSVYYNFVRILVKPEKQVLNTMFARLYLLQAVECVLHNALNILGIEPVTKM
ncbi:DALR anticodon-binding domain-containing protein 3 isoform X2 [Anabrus simplex]|uniref:DALR anticodon-binding domain-containing protein 3 isoform X2 n=1 Tax=Anabrus simplex TaxID=316456 RepID=UPI0035A34FB7